MLGLLAWLLVATSKVLPSNRFRRKLLSVASAIRRTAQPFRRNWLRSTTIRSAPSAKSPTVFRANMLPSIRLSLISLSSSPYAAEPQLSSNRLSATVTLRLYITATPEPFAANTLRRYSQLSEYMKWRP